MDSNSRRRSGLLKIKLRKAGRSSSPPAVSTFEPNLPTTSASPGLPGITTARADSSESMTGTPNSWNRCATVLLPLAMPPVRPMRRRGSMGLMAQARYSQVSADEHIAIQHREPPGGRQVGPKWHRRGTITTAQDDHQNAEHRSGCSRQYNDQGQE